MGIRTTTEIKANGTGALTAAVLLEVLATFPGSAVVQVATGDSQREGSYWSVTATVRS